MKDVFRRHELMISCFISGLWVFAAWRLAGMPSPGFYGRILPGAWVLAGILSGRTPSGKWLPVSFSVFTVCAWLWQLAPFGWYLAAAAAAAGILAASAATVIHGGGVLRGLLPVLLLSILTAEVNSDEVRFAEIASSTTGISSVEWAADSLRSGDIQSGISHHTVLYPTVISPGLLAGDNGLRVVPALISVSAVALLAITTGAVPALLAGVLYPGFSTLGLAYTGWFAVLIFLLALKFGGMKYGVIIRVAAAVLLTALKLRYAALGAGILAAEYFLSSGGKRSRYLIPCAAAGVVLLFLALDRYLLEGRIFWVRYGNMEALKLIWINLFHRPDKLLAHLGWSLFDPEAGLFLRAPWILAALAGLPELYKRNRDLFYRLVIPAGLYWITLIVWLSSFWHGLPAPSGRMFLPLLPLFAAGFSQVWKKPASLLLAAVSAVVTASIIAFPAARANFADGTDALLGLLGGSGGFSMVRSNPFNLLIPVVLTAGMLTLLRKRRFTCAPAALLLLVALFFAGIAPAVPDAEDLDGTVVQGALFYPRDPDPVERAFWFTGTERRLEFSEPGHSMVLAAPDTCPSPLLIEMSSAGGVLQVGDTLITVETDLISIPEEYLFIRRNQRELPDWPENRAMETYRLIVGRYGSDLRISWHSGEPIYIDRAGFL